MNTQTISQFEFLDTELLATVEGGACNRIDGGKAVLGSGLGGAAIGFITGGPVGAALGWHLGGLEGMITYYGTCWIG